MARPKKTTTAKKTTRKPATKAATARGKKTTTDKAQMSANLKSQTAAIKLLKGTTTAHSNGMRRPPNNPDVPQEIIDTLNADFNSILELLDACPKAYGFWANRHSRIA